MVIVIKLFDTVTTQESEKKRDEVVELSTNINAS